MRAVGRVRYRVEPGSGDGGRGGPLHAKLAESLGCFACGGRAGAQRTLTRVDPYCKRFVQEAGTPPPPTVRYELLDRSDSYAVARGRPGRAIEHCDADDVVRVVSGGLQLPRAGVL